MNFIRQLFSRREELPSQPPAESLTGTAPAEDLFTYATPPQAANPETDTPIARFLSRDYLALGMSDGFEYHSKDHLQASRRRIRAEFLTLMDRVILAQREQRRHIRDRMVDVESLSVELYGKLQLTLEEVEHSLALLERQKALAVEEEGWLMQALNAYHQGYLQGLHDRLESDDLLGKLNLI